MKNNNITVGIPFYSKTIIDEFILAIDSILEQSLKPYEIHLIQDGNISVELKKVVERYLNNNNCIKHIKLNKSNLSTVLNHSIKLTKTKYYARMDSDDISMPNRLRNQYNFLEKNPSIYILGSWAIEFLKDINDRSNFIKKVPDDYSDIIKFYHYRNPLIHPTVIFRKDLFDIVGYYNEELSSDQDLELWGRSINFKLGISNIQEPLLYHNVNGVHDRRTRLSSIRNQIFSRYLVSTSSFKLNILKILAICFRFMPRFIIEYGYRKLR